MLAIRSVKFDRCIAVARFALFSEALLLAHAEAAAGNPQPATQAAQAAASRSAPRVDGEVRKVHVARGPPKLKHGAIQNLDTSGLAMVFHAAEPKLLEGQNLRDKVRATVDRVNGSGLRHQAARYAGSGLIHALPPLPAQEAAPP